MAWLLTRLFRLQKVFPNCLSLGELTLDIINPWYEYVPSEFVDLFATNMYAFETKYYRGTHPTSYLCRLLVDHYDAEDTFL